MITIYSKPNCPYCDAAKNWFDIHNFEYETVDVTQDAEAMTFVVGNGHKTVPQLYHNGQLLVEGGHKGLLTLGADNLRERLSK